MNFFLLVIGTMSIVRFAKTQQTGVKWNKRSKNFEPIAGLMTYEAARRKVILQSRQQETEKFNGQPMNLTYYEDFRFFEYSDNDTKATGICGDIWTELSNYLNFTLVLSKSTKRSVGGRQRDGSYNGVLEYARLNQTDVVPKIGMYASRLVAVEFSSIFWTNSQRIFAVGEWKHNRAWMFNLVSKNVWALILMFIGALSLANIVTQRILIRHRGHKIEAENFVKHFFYTFAMMCSQTSSSGSKNGSGSKILNLTIAVFSLVTLAGYNSFLIYSMAAKHFVAPFNDIETLLDKTNFRIAMLEGSDVHHATESHISLPIFQRIKKLKRLTVETNTDRLYEKVCKYSNKYVMIHAEDAIAVRRPRECNVIPVGTAYYQIPIAAGISRRVKNRKSINIAIMKFREFGLLDGIKKRYMPPTSAGSMIREANSMSIDMDRVSVIFGVLCLGIVLSIIICIVENIIFTLKRRKPAQYPVERIATIKPPIPSINRTCYEIPPIKETRHKISRNAIYF